MSKRKRRRWGGAGRAMVTGRLRGRGRKRAPSSSSAKADDPAATTRWMGRSVPTCGDQRLLDAPLSRGMTQWRLGQVSSHLEQLLIARLDVVGHLFDAGWSVLHELDLGQLLVAGLVLDQRMDRMLAGEIDQQLLALQGMQPVLKQARGVRIGGGLEHPGRTRDGRGALCRVGRLDRLARVLELEQIVVVAVRHHGALAERKLLW